MPEQIVITISPEGAVTVEAQGFTGKTCESATKAIENALGAVNQRTKKPEYHLTAERASHVVHRA